LTLFNIQCFSFPTHVPILIILRLSVTELRLLNLIHSLTETVTAHAPCRVTYNRGGGKMVYIFEIPDPNFIHFVHFQGATTKITPCYWRK